MKHYEMIDFSQLQTNQFSTYSHSKSGVQLSSINSTPDALKTFPLEVKPPIIVNGNVPGGNDSNDGSARDTTSFTPGFLKTARHPFICMIHILFKVLALLTFLFGSFLFGGWNGDFVFTFVSTTALVSIDFWTVKNVTGRFLVGMRWWNSLKEDGTSDWIYEARTDERAINATDKTIFWTVLYLWSFCWFFFLFIYLFRFEAEWVLLVLIGLALSLANLIGYWNCSKEAKRQTASWTTSSAMKSFISRFI